MKHRLQETVGLVLLADIDDFNALYLDCKIPFSEQHLVEKAVNPVIQHWHDKFMRAAF